MTEMKLFFCFILILYPFMPSHLCYADTSRLHNSMEEVEVMKHLNRLNKPPVKSIKSPDGDIIDCVHISHQPAFDHPLLKNHTIKTRPNYHPKHGPLTSTSEEAITQLWHSNGKCPKGTIPIIRTKKEDVLRASSVKSYGKKKKNFHVAQRSSINPEINDPRQGHEYAVARTDQGLYYGAQATINLWNPEVQENNEFSLSQLWIRGGPDSYMNTMEVGWQVFPGFYGDTNTRLFIYWTSDGYRTTGCYNLKCYGFVQTNNEIAIGGSMSPTSQVDGSQIEITILIWKDKRDGDWWMQLNGKVIGYWPASLFYYLRESASLVDFGGEVINRFSDGQHTTTQMGSGHFPQEGYKKASYIRNIQTVDESNALRTPQDLSPITPQETCYDLVKGINNDKWGNHFFYGGPGRNQNCP